MAPNGCFAPFGIDRAPRGAVMPTGLRAPRPESTSEIPGSRVIASPGDDTRRQLAAADDLMQFHAFFDGDTGRGRGRGRGRGASHQTGWTALVANCLERLGRARSAAASADVARGRI